MKTKITPLIAVILLVLAAYSTANSQQQVIHGEDVKPVQTAVINFMELEDAPYKLPGNVFGKFVIHGHEFPERYEEQVFRGQEGHYPGFKYKSDDRYRTLTASPAASASFEALDDANWTIPPDVAGAAGPQHLMVPLNDRVRIMDKSGSAITTLNLSSFWSALNVNRVFDPKILYDPYGNRWIFTTCADPMTDTASVLLGVTQSDDPTSTWYLAKFKADNADTLWADYPSIGFSKNWIGISLNMFTNSGNSFKEVRIWAVNKDSAYANAWYSDLLKETSGIAFTLVPATTYSPDKDTLFLMETYTTQSSYCVYRQATIAGSVDSPELTYYTYQNYINGGSYSAYDSTYDAPQKDDNCRIETNDARLLDLVYRNGSLWGCHTLFSRSTPFKTGVKWFEVITSSGEVQSGQILHDDDSVYYAFPSIAVNSADEAVIGFSYFNSNTFAGAGYAFRASSDGSGAMRDPRVLKSGMGEYCKDFGAGVVRWGDYTGTMIDPVNDLDFWTIQEYADSGRSVTDYWSTWWGKVDYQTSCPTSINLNNSVYEQSQTETYSASGSIVAPKYGTYLTADGNGSSGATLTLQAGSSVKLMPGFHAKKGASVLAQIQSCSPAIPYDEEPLAVEEKDDFDRVLIYPNPNYGRFTMEFKDMEFPIRIDITDIMGNTVYNNVINRNDALSIDISQFSGGMYYARVFSGGEMQLFKVVYQ